MLRSLLPHGWVTLSDWKQRFKRIGLPGSLAWSRAKRQALISSRFELLPQVVGRQLRCVLDVGANKGDWAGSLLELCNIETLIAFEPNPNLAEELRHRFASRHLVKNFTLHQAAVGKSASEVSFNITVGSALSSVLTPNEKCHQLYPADSAIAKIIKVPMIRLDDVIPSDQVVDVFKLDVQGFEQTALEGSYKVLERTKAILLETHFISHYLNDDCISSLFDLMINKYKFRYCDMSPSERDSNGRAIWADCCFVNPALVNI